MQALRESGVLSVLVELRSLLSKVFRSLSKEEYRLSASNIESVALASPFIFSSLVLAIASA
jgi:hypothetical protein